MMNRKKIMGVPIMCFCVVIAVCTIGIIIGSFLDAVCLAVTASMKNKGHCETVPDKPCKDARGLFMQMVIPKI